MLSNILKKQKLVLINPTKVLRVVFVFLLFFSQSVSADKSDDRNAKEKKEQKEPEITAISPKKGSLEGGYEVTIKAKNLPSDAKVFFSGIEQELIERKKNQLVVRVSSTNSPHEAIVSIRSSVGSFTAKDAFEYFSLEPILSSILGDNGPVYGGTRIFVKGENFTKNMELTISGYAAKLIKIFNSKSALYVSTEGKIGLFDVTIRNHLGFSTLKDAFTYLEAKPSIDKVLPNKGLSAGGKKIHIIGQHFTAGTKVYFDSILSEETIVRNSRLLATVVPPLNIWNNKKVDIKIETPYGSTIAAEVFHIIGKRDVDGPTIAMTSPNNLETYLSPTPVITFEITDNLSGIDFQSLQIFVDSTISRDFKLNDSTLVWNPIAGLNHGEHVLIVKIQDVAGNSSSQQYHLNIDANLPVINLESPLAESIFSTPNGISIVGDVFDAESGVKIDSLEVYLDESPLQVNLNGLGFNYSSNDLVDGTHKIKVSATDLVGNKSEFSTSFCVDTTEPIISVLSPREGSFLSANILLVQGSVSDTGCGLDSSSLYVTLDDVEQQVAFIESGNFSVPIVIDEEGVHELQIKVSDLAGNQALSKVEFTFDKTQPLLTITNPSEDNVVFTTATPTIAASYLDIVSGIDKYSIRIFIDDQQHFFLTGVEVDGFEVVLQNLDIGHHSLRVEVSDLSGLLTSLTRSFSINLNPPDNNGTVVGDFGILKTITSGVNAKNLRIVDSNGDGKLDIVFKDINDNKVKVVYQ